MIVRGSLHKFYNVMVIEMNGDQYLHVMGHTSEFLQLVISKIKGKQEVLVNGKSFFSNELGQYGFFQAFHSCCLFDVYAASIFQIFGQTTFEQIWLVDRI